ncbi:MAG: histidinol-phosphatase [Clostridia bacterium]|nr:histidinol-phosphatase [Clostridia bacterium]
MKAQNYGFLTANYHTHTYRCHHANGTEREYIEEAIRSGIKILGFSDHSPMVFDGKHTSGHRMALGEADDYVSTLTALREEYKEDIEIHIGYEMEYYPKFFEASIREICRLPIEYLILGQHFIDNEIEGHHASARSEDENYLARYVDQVIEAMETGVFSYIAHPDLSKFLGAEDAYSRQMKRLCEAALAHDLPLEINYLGLMEGRNYPSDRFFRIAKETGNRFIIGCDAHRPDMLDIDRVKEKCEEFCTQLGITASQELTLKDPHLYVQK